MRKFVLSLAGLLAGSLLAHAQLGESMYGDEVKFDVKMKYVYSFEEAVRKAKAENKLIFFNCFADWAVPCHSMNNKVFSNRKFADWMDRHFVNFITDVTKPAGRPLADRYNIRYQAHYLVLDQQGKVVHRIVGGCGLPEFQKKLALALNPKTSLAGLNERFAEGERGTRFLNLYAQVLSMADEDAKYDSITTLYFSKIRQKDWPRKENWTFYKDKIRKPEGEMFKYLMDHRADFIRHNGKVEVDSFIVSLYTIPLYYMAASDKKYDVQTLLDIYMTLQNMDVPDDDPVYTLYRIAKYRKEEDFDRMMQVFEEEVPRLDERIGSGLNLSLKDRGEGEQVRRIAAYYSRCARTAKGRLKKEYEYLARQLVNPEGIRFEKSSFDEAMAKAAGEGRLLFLDCYTSWCGPCKMMSKEIFTQKEVGDFFNDRFVSLKMDMEKGEGKELQRRFGVSAFPTMLLLDDRGRIVYKLVGGADAPEFLEKIRRALDPDNCYYKVKERYEAGERDPGLMAAYFVAMQDAMELKEAGKMASIYLDGLQGEERFGKAAWKMLDILFTDYASPEFRFICEHRSELARENGAPAVDGKITSTLMRVLTDFFRGSTAAPDAAVIRSLMEAAAFPEDSELASLARVFVLFAGREEEELLQYYETKVAALKDERLKFNLNFMLGKLFPEATDAQWERIVEIFRQSEKIAGPEFRPEYAKALKKMEELEE